MWACFKLDPERFFPRLTRQLVTGWWQWICSKFTSKVVHSVLSWVFFLSCQNPIIIGHCLNVDKSSVLYAELVCALVTKSKSQNKTASNGKKMWPATNTNKNKWAWPCTPRNFLMLLMSGSLPLLKNASKPLLQNLIIVKHSTGTLN